MKITNTILTITGLTFMASVFPTHALAQEAGLNPEEIVVTARKKDESLQDVPVTLSVFSEDTLEHKRIDNVDGLLTKTPSLFVSQNQTFGPAKSETYITIRGVGATTPLEPAVAVFVDGVYQPKLAFDIGFLDLERVEILRGPQGALFGRNTQGGAINLVTKKPGNELSGKVTAHTDEHDTYGIKARANIPLIEDRLYWSVSGLNSHTNGFLRNVTLNRDQEEQDKIAYRTSLLAHLSDTLSATLALFGSDLSGGHAGPGVPTGLRKYKVFDNDRRDIVDETLGSSLTLEWEIDDLLLTSISGYADVDTRVFFDFDGSAIAKDNFQIQDLGQKSISQELRLASNYDDSRLDWLGGFYYFESSYDQARDFSMLDNRSSGHPIFNPNNFVNENADFEREGWAAFGQLNYYISDAWELTLGARYSTEDVKARQFGVVTLTGLKIDNRYDRTSRKTFNGFSPMTSLSYKLNQDVMLYSTVSRGFRAGGFPKYPFEQRRTGIAFDNEESTNYELGVKSVLFDRTLSLNAAIYRIDIKDQQLASQVDGPAGVPVEGIDNVGKSTNQGAELEVTWLPADGLKLFANLAYIDAEFDEYIDDKGNDRGGENVPYIPEFTANAGIEYRHPVGGDGRLPAADLTWALDYSYVDNYTVGNGTGTFDPRIPIDSIDFWNVSATLSNEQWDVVLYVDNVTNEFNVLRTWQSPFHNPARFSYDTVLPPRTIGLKVSYNFF